MALSKDDQLGDQIATLKSRRVIEEGKLVERDLAALVDMIDSLNRIAPTVSMEIDRQYYFCYGEGAVQQTQTGGVLVYVVRGESFARYLQNAYGQSVTVSQGGVRGGSDISLYRPDIFSSIWASTFGEPMINRFNNDNSFIGDFNCLTPSGLQSGQGVISSIKNNHMRVNTNSGSVDLNLGACSRIESDIPLPRVGQDIAFKGVPSSAGGYNVYSVTCW